MQIQKDLIVISSYCPTPEKEEKLLNLVERLQGLRDFFDLLVVSHTPVSKEICSKIDHFYYDSNNEILRDFDLSYLSWFINDDFYIETSLVRNISTVLPIARQVRYSINFADFWGYKKVHYMEYDFIYKGDETILDINKKLDEYDTVMFEHPLNTGLFASSVYFAFNTNGLEEESRNFNRDKFIEIVKNPHLDLEISGRDTIMTNHGRMTENLNVMLLSKNNRRCLFLPSEGVDQSEDSHSNSDLNWTFPIYDREGNCIRFFVHNNLHSPHRIEVILNGESIIRLECLPGDWHLNYLSEIDGDKDIEIWVNGFLNKKIEINDFNRGSFLENNYIREIL